MCLNHSFNLELNNLPNGIKKIVFCILTYDHVLNCLPNSVEYLHLSRNYEHKLEKIPKNLKKIFCTKKYKYTEHLINNGIEIEFYKGM